MKKSLLILTCLSICSIYSIKASAKKTSDLNDEFAIPAPKVRKTKSSEKVISDLRFDLLGFEEINDIIQSLSPEQQKEFDSMLLNAIVTSKGKFYKIFEPNSNGQMYRDYVRDLIWNRVPKTERDHWLQYFLNNIKNPIKLYVAMCDIALPFDEEHKIKIVSSLSETERCELAFKLYQNSSLFNKHEMFNIFCLCFGENYSDQKTSLRFMRFLKSLNGMAIYTIFQNINTIHSMEAAAIDDVFKFTKEHLDADVTGNWAASPEGKEYIDALLSWGVIASKVVIQLTRNASYALSISHGLIHFLIRQVERIPVHMRSLKTNAALTVLKNYSHQEKQLASWARAFESEE